MYGRTGPRTRPAGSRDRSLHFSCVLRSCNLVSRGDFTRSRACIDNAPNIPPLQASRALPKTLDRVLARTGVIAADVEDEAAEAVFWLKAASSLFV